MFNPKVSIIIPVYKGANYMREAIDSALSQTYKNTEIIVVNDGSPDNGETEKIALSYGDKIRYIAKENGGSSSAINVGIKNMTGEYFSWLSHDDLYEPQRIEVMLSHIDELKKDKQIVICGAHLIDANGNNIYYPPSKRCGIYTREEMMKMFRVSNAINGCGIIIPKNIIDEVGFFDETLCYVNDVDYWFRMIILGGEYVIIDDKLIKTRIHGEQVTVKKAELFRKESKILAKKVFDKLFLDVDKNMELIKIFLNKSSYDSNMEEVKEAVLRLKKENKFDFSIYSSICSNYFNGKIRKIAKKLYKKIFFKR